MEQFARHQRRHFSAQLYRWVCRVGRIAIARMTHSLQGKEQQSVKVPHFSGQGQAGYLFVSIRWSVSVRNDGLQPKLQELHGTELPDSIRQGQRLTV